MALEVVVVNLYMSACLQSINRVAHTHVLASEGLQRIARLNNSKTFGITLNDILVLVVLQKRFPLLAAVFAPASVLCPRCLESS